MDVGAFLSSLKEDYKTAIVAGLLLFPLAYADCWKFSDSFRALGLAPQFMLSAAVAICLLMEGWTLNVILNSFYRYIHLKLEVYVIVLISAFCTICTLLGWIINPLHFVVVWQSAIGVILPIQFFRAVLAKKECAKIGAEKEAGEENP